MIIMHERVTHSSAMELTIFVLSINSHGSQRVS
jgi:hypothetical protein